MRTVLTLLPDFLPGSALRQASLVAAQLPRDRFRVHLAALGRDTADAATLRAGGVEATALDFRRPIDVLAWRRWTALVERLRPDVVHAWRWPAAAAARVLTRRPLWPAGLPAPRLIASEVLRGAPLGGFSSRLARALLAGIDRLVAAGPAEAADLHAFGLPGPCVTVVPPGVCPPGPPPERDAFLHSVGLPADVRLVIAGGRLVPERDFRDAAWAFDILKYVHPKLALVTAGEGPERGRIDELARALGKEDVRTRLVGPRDDFPALLQLADVAWVTGSVGGRQAALEAMAAGVPVVAVRRPELVELVTEAAGVFVPVGDRRELARQTRLLLDDPPRRQRLGDAGRTLARLNHPPGRVTDALARLYG
jgi:glycosyltransferase involved in cell wall biosynthesis